MGNSRISEAVNKVAEKKRLEKEEKKKAAGAEKTNQPAPPPPPNVEIYFDAGLKDFFARNARGEWIPHKETQIVRYLKSKGFVERTMLPNGLDVIENKMLETMHQKDVDFAGPLAGYKPGFHISAGSRVLVTKGPKFIEPVKGAWPLFKIFLDQLLGDNGVWFMGWMRSAVVSLRQGPPWRPGQMLAIAGPAGSGKSFLQGVITEILGGRTASPYRYMSGETQFNGDLLGCEHLAIADVPAGTDMKSRRIFAAQLKGLTVNEFQNCHPKKKQAMTLTPFWRISITLNERPEDLMVLPPLEDSIRDKITLLKARPVQFPYKSEDLAGRTKYRQAISAELPAFLFDLLEWKIPKEMVCKRFGIKAYLDPELQLDVDDLSPEFRVLESIDRLFPWQPDRETWEGSSSDLERELMDLDQSGEVARMIKNGIQLGLYLSKLSSRFPGRFLRTRGNNNTRKWVIKLVPQNVVIPRIKGRF